MSEEELQAKFAKKKAAQAKAHKKWRESEKGKAYYQRLKEKNATGSQDEPTHLNTGPFLAK